MEILRNYDLTKLNTLGVPARAKELIEIHSEQNFKELFNLPDFSQNKKIFLGGGSNVLFVGDFDGIVVLNKLKGIAPTKVGVPTGVGEDYVYIRAMSGEIWDDLVSFSVDRGYWGIENLAFIPGTVGGAPVQNIGAYGAELKDVLVQVEAYSVADGSKKIFTKAECEFAYRDSVFKNRLKGQYFISAITLKLSIAPAPNLSYKILLDYLEENKIKVENSRDISSAVTNIRKSKLPDPKIIPNAGSFFKNVFVNKEELDKLKEKFPDITYFTENDRIKIPSAYLIEQCGYKGKRVGNVGVHAQHALVLVNYGEGTGKEIEALANEIIDSAYLKFGLTLVPEVNFL